MKRRDLISGAMFACCILMLGQVNAEEKGPAKTRAFRLDYGATLVDLPAGAKVRIWVPVPSSNDHQDVEVLKRNVPAKFQVTKDATYGNKMLYFETTAPESGRVTFNTPYMIRRNEVRALDSQGDRRRLSEQERSLFLSANSKVPLAGKQLSLLENVDFGEAPLDIARTLYNRVDDHVRYDKSKPGYGNGDVLWVCDSRFGNCTDFHSLFISWARAKGLPARFEIGFPLPTERGKGKIGGYHCWALFYSDEQGWVPVDISEADKHPEMKEYYFGNLTENRVTFTTGRDIELVPKQASDPLNYFVYPHVEVNGKLWSKDKTKLDFRYTDAKN